MIALRADEPRYPMEDDVVNQMLGMIGMDKWEYKMASASYQPSAEFELSEVIIGQCGIWEMRF